MTARLSWAEVCARRLDRQALAAPSSDASPAAVAGVLCGVHAQVMSAAEMSVGLRIAGSTRDDVRRALWDERSLVKTRGPRGTVHLLPARDLPMWTGALAALPPSRSPFPDDVRLSPEQTDQVVEAIRAALADAELTVDELTQAIVAATGPWAGDLVMEAFQTRWPRWRQVEHLAAHRGALCYGPHRGRHVTYTSPGRWLPGFRPAAGPAAVADLVTRYLHAYGPATSAQFAQWLGAPPPWAAETFASLGGRLERVDGTGAPAWAPSGGTAAWVVAGDVAAPVDPPRGVRLLPYFDAYAVGCHPRPLVFPGPAGERALAPSGQAGNYPVLLVDGTAAGVWHSRRSGRRLDVTVEPFGRLAGARRRALDVEVERLAAFLGATPQLTIGTIPVGGHA